VSGTPEMTPPATSVQEPEATSGPVMPPPPTSATNPPPGKLYTQPFLQWFGLGTVRIIYRQWTQVATHIIPEGSPQAKVAERIGIPLPDRLDLSWIDSTLAVGGRIRPRDIGKLQRAGITRVVDVRKEYRDDEVALNKANIELLYLPTPDTYPLSLEDLKRGAQWINEQRKAGQRVLIHCEHGVGRSVLLTAAALVCDGYTPTEAFTLVQNKRWQAAPNRRQALRLNDFERSGGCGANSTP